jgi:hypothetical protein
MIESRWSCFVLAAMLCVACAGVASAQAPPPKPPPSNIKKAPITKTGDDTYEMGGLQFNSATREIRIPTVINMREGVIEYALVTDMGKTHESLLSTKVRPFDVNVAMLLCHYEPHAGEIIKMLREPTPELAVLAKKKIEHPGANHVLLTVEWSDKDGKHTAPMGSWIHNEREKKTLDIPYWIYNGSDMGDGIFMADGDGSFISVHFDLVGILGSNAKWFGDDNNWTLETNAIPPVNYPVTLIISPAPSSSSQPSK